MADSIQDVLKARTPEWMALPGVEGTAIGLLGDEACIKVYVRAKTDELSTQIPSRVEGYRVTLQATGDIRPLEK